MHWVHDESGFHTFFIKGEGNLPDLLGIEDEQLLAIQNDLHQRMKARDEAREEQYPISYMN